MYNVHVIHLLLPSLSVSSEHAVSRRESLQLLDDSDAIRPSNHVGLLREEQTVVRFRDHHVVVVLDDPLGDLVRVDSVTGKRGPTGEKLIQKC